MKRFLLSLAMIMMAFVSVNAMSYEQAREHALFLTDKMAYELNLDEAQYEAAYEINLDYLMGVNTYDDLYAEIWTRRNLDLSYILLDWQYSRYCSYAYFYRPLTWDAGYWHFGIYAHYPVRTFFYFDRPTVYVSYHGAHAWHLNGGRSWYHGNYHSVNHGTTRVGMRDRWSRGEIGIHNSRHGNSSSGSYRGGFHRDGYNGSVSGREHSGNRGNDGVRGNNFQRSENGGNNGNTTGGHINRREGDAGSRFGGSATQPSGNRTIGSQRESSTRTTVNRGSFSRGGSSSATPSRSFGAGSSSPTRSFGSGSSYGGSRSSAGSSHSFGGGGSRGGASNGGGGGFHAGRR